MIEIDKRRSITLWENGKPVKLRINGGSSCSDVDELSKKEQAASVQNEEGDPVPTFARLTNKKNKNLGINTKLKYIKPLFIPIFSALLIGSVLGFIMLRMFVTLDSEGASGGGNATLSTLEDEKTEQKAQNESSMVQINGIAAFVLQAGVFNEEANAVEWKQNYAKRNIPAIVWENNKQFYLFVGIAKTEAQAKSLGQQLQKNELDVYVKEWQTEGVKAQLSQAEFQWVQSFQKEWKASVNALSGEQVFAVENWKELSKSLPENTRNLTILDEEIKNLTKEMQDADNKQAQGILLSLWRAYEKMVVQLNG